MRFLYFFLFLLPTTALAAPPVTYTLMAPIGSLPASVTLKQYMNGMFETIIGLAGMLAVIMIVVCAIRLMGTGSVSGKSEAKQCIWNAIFGVLLAIGSWILLNTINPQLLRNDADLTVVAPAPAAAAKPTGNDAKPKEPGWYFRYVDANGNERNSLGVDTSAACLALQRTEIDNGITITNECFEISRGTPPPAPNNPAPGPIVVPPPAGSAGELATRNSLCGNDSCVGSKPLGINKNSCVGSNTSCTNVAGLDAGTVAFLKGLPGSCGCDVVITGGTEAGHSSHGPNIPVFDLSRTPALLNFIKANATVKANPSFCNTTSGVCFSKWLYNGYWFTDETGGAQYPHWHVCKDGTAAPAGKSAGLFLKACTKI